MLLLSFFFQRLMVDSNSAVEVVDKALEEMQLLDAALLKAEKVRAPPHNKPKCPPHSSERSTTSSLSTKSCQEAAKIYKQPAVRMQNRARRANSSSKICTRVAANTGQRQKSASSTKKNLPSTTKMIGGIGVQYTAESLPPSGKEAKDIRKRVCTAPVSSESEREVDAMDTLPFDIKKNG